MTTAGDAIDPFGQDPSGTSTFSITTKSLISESFDILQMGVEGEDLSEDMLTRAQRSLNIMVRNWQAQGIHLWTYDEATVFLEGGTRTYTPETSRGSNDYWFSYLAADVLLGDSIGTLKLPLDRYGPRDVQPQIGWTIGFLRPDNREYFWTTLVSYDIGGGDFELSDPFPVDMLEGTFAVIYELPIRPIERVLGVRRVDGFLNDTPINFESRQKYFDLPTKLASGAISEAYYDRDLPQGVLYLWPTPQDGSQFVRLRYERRLFDFVDLDDCADLPQYYYEALVYGLARRLAIKYRVPPNLYTIIKEMADEQLTEALNFDNEITDISVSLNRESR